MAEHDEETYDAPRITDKRRMATPEQEAATKAALTEAETIERQRLGAYIAVHSSEMPEELNAYDDFGDMPLELMREMVMQHQAEADDSVDVKDMASGGQQVLTAFLVVIDYDGSAKAVADLSVISDYEFERSPTFTDFFNGASQVVKDVTEMETAERVVGAMMRHTQEQMLRAAMQRQAEAKEPAPNRTTRRAAARKG